jgi:hypothetical protein
MKMPHTFLVLAALPAMLAGCICGETHKSAGTKPAKLEMKVTMFSLDEEKFGNKKETQVDAEIRNVGETTVLLPTKGLGPFVDSEVSFQLISFSSDWYLSTRDGFRIPKAKSELAIVELRPREAITLGCTLDGTNVSPARVGVEYKISKEFAERYGTWHGEISRHGADLR